MMNNAAPLTLAELRRRPHWSFSSIDSLVNRCSLSWAFGHVYDTAPMFTPLPLAFGGVFHSALVYAFSRMSEDRPWSSGNTTDLFADLLNDRITRADPPVRLEPGTTKLDLIAQGQRMIEAYLGQVDPAESVLDVSVPFSSVLTDAEGEPLPKPLIGEFDLVIERDGLPVIVDWKTSARRWPKNKAGMSLQPTCYLHAWKQLHETPDAGFRFDVVTKAKEPVCEHHHVRREPDDFVRLGQIVKKLDTLVEHECFLPTDASWECKSCPYSLACQSWHREHAATHVHFERPVLELAA